MRPAMPVVSLLFLLLLLAETSRGIRLEVEFLALLHKIIHKERFKGEGVAADVSYKEDEHCSGTKKEMSCRAVKVVHHRPPGLHEDYFGPRNHKSKHHFNLS